MVDDFVVVKFLDQRLLLEVAQVRRTSRQLVNLDLVSHIRGFRLTSESHFEVIVQGLRLLQRECSNRQVAAAVYLNTERPELGHRPDAFGLKLDLLHDKAIRIQVVSEVEAFFGLYGEQCSTTSAQVRLRHLDYAFKRLAIVCAQSYKFDLSVLFNDDERSLLTNDEGQMLVALHTHDLVVQAKQNVRLHELVCLVGHFDIEHLLSISTLHHQAL